MSVTVQQMALELLPYIGVTQLTPQPAGSELEDVQTNDLDFAARAIGGAVQEYMEMSPLENREVNTGAYLFGPTAVHLDVTNGSTTVANFTTYASWMGGCTIRVAGDDQDNEVIGATRLARPYMGSTASGVAATVFGDAITLPSNYSRAISPVTLPNQLPLRICDDLEEFLRLSGYPGVVGSDGFAAGLPFFYFIRKSVSRPRIVFAQGAYDSSLAYVPRRLRFAPMPDQAYPIGFRAALNPPRYTRADIVSGLTTLAATGATSDTNANQSYTYIGDVNGYRAFAGVTHPAYGIFYLPTPGSYILASTFALGGVPAAYWQSALVTSPLGTFAIEGTATGAVTVTTSDAGGAAADPGTIIPVVDDAVELVLLPMALQRFTRHPSFKNAGALPEILRQYRTARDKLLNSRVLGAGRDAFYA